MREILHVVIRGKVQGVSFRAWTVRQAGSLGVDGWVRNREDGAVEAIVAGHPENLRKLLDISRVGPAAAVVTDVISLPHDQEPGPGFHIRP
jgi:acylphosphatase